MRLIEISEPLYQKLKDQAGRVDKDSQFSLTVAKNLAINVKLALDKARFVAPRGGKVDPELKEVLRRCGELALSRKTGAIQHLVKDTLGIENFERTD